MNVPAAPQPALVLLAHGSPDARHARDVAGLVTATAAESGPGAPVSAAYLDHHGPSAAQCAADLVSVGARAAVVVPLFTALGYHVRVDVPQAVAVMSAAGMDIALAEPGVAGSPELVDLALAGQVARGEPTVLFAAGSKDAAAGASLRAQVRDLSARSGVPFATAFLTGGHDLGAALAELADHDLMAADVQVVPFVIADGVLRDQMQLAASRCGVTLVPGSLATTSGLAAQIVAAARCAQRVPA